MNGSKGCFESEVLRKETKRLLSSVEVDFPLDKIIQSKVRKKDSRQVQTNFRFVAAEAPIISVFWCPREPKLALKIAKDITLKKSR